MLANRSYVRFTRGDDMASRFCEADADHTGRKRAAPEDQLESPKGEGAPEHTGTAEQLGLSVEGRLRLVRVAAGLGGGPNEGVTRSRTASFYTISAISLIRPRVPSSFGLRLPDRAPVYVLMIASRPRSVPTKVLSGDRACRSRPLGFWKTSRSNSGRIARR